VSAVQREGWKLSRQMVIRHREQMKRGENHLPLIPFDSVCDFVAEARPIGFYGLLQHFKFYQPAPDFSLLFYDAPLVKFYFICPQYDTKNNDFVASVAAQITKSKLNQINKNI